MVPNRELITPLQFQLASIVDLYRALGGGWSLAPTETDSD
jgi:hypothetical protein